MPPRPALRPPRPKPRRCGPSLYLRRNRDCSMIERIIEFSIRNRFLVLALTVALAIAGIYAAVRTPVDAIPDLSENQVIVFADWMGRSPREIEDQVTYPLSR